MNSTPCNNNPIQSIDDYIREVYEHVDNYPSLNNSTLNDFNAIQNTNLIVNSNKECVIVLFKFSSVGDVILF